ncbi:MAG TPA: DUF763 domain-containing protein, partial [Acidobacteriota bacterium]
CGGRGRHSRKTPYELRVLADKISLDGEALVRTSRPTAKIDNNAIQDGFQIYLHNFVATADGEWAVIQQGMNEATGLARRYHWHSQSVRDFVCEPHSAIVGDHQGMIMNLVDSQAMPAQTAMLEIVKQNPEKILHEARHLVVPRHHDVRAEDVNLNRLGAVLAVAYEREFRDFASLLLLENLGPRTLQSLALIAEVVHGAPTRFSDPARFSFAHGGKDGHPFPVPRKTYDESISVLRSSLDAAKLGDKEKLDGFRRLEQFTRNIESRCEPEANFKAVMAHEHEISASLDGRTVFDDKKKGSPKSRNKQLPLF